jgi:hypothetical protein
MQKRFHDVGVMETFKLFHNHDISEREYHKAVFTPPRDDFGMAPKPPFFEDTSVAEIEDTSHPTRQALCLVLRLICCVGVTIASMIALYMLLSSLIKEPKVNNCLSQRIQHGALMPGMEGDKPFVQCDKGFMTGAPVEALTCMLIFEHCEIEKKATVMKAAVEKCTRKYAYTMPEVAKAAQVKLVDKASEKKVSKLEEQVNTKSTDKVPHACLLDPSQLRKSKSDTQGSTKLYEWRAPPFRGLEKMGGLSATSISLAALVALVLVAMLANAGVNRSRSNYAFRPIDSSCPPSAVEEALEDDCTSQPPHYYIRSD